MSSDRPVSIRAPARGATSFFSPYSRIQIVSIRAPARGATQKLNALIDPVKVSIRAPVTGGDTACLVARISGWWFQSAPPHGGRQLLTWSLIVARVFLSAPPHGGRLDFGLNAITSCAFQSAPPHGGRPSLTDSLSAISIVSIRAPARGATSSEAVNPTVVNVSNPRPRTGGDRGRPKRPEESRLVSSLREPCLVGDVTHPHNTFTPSQPLGWKVVTTRANLHART